MASMRITVSWSPAQTAAAIERSPTIAAKVPRHHSSSSITRCRQTVRQFSMPARTRRWHRSMKIRLHRSVRLALWSRHWSTLPRPQGKLTTLPIRTPVHCWVLPLQRPIRPTATGSIRLTTAQAGLPWVRLATAVRDYWPPTPTHVFIFSRTRVTTVRWPMPLASTPGIGARAATAAQLI